MVTAVDASESAGAGPGKCGRPWLAERVKFLSSDWFSALPAGGLFELIVANPPYLSAEETAQAAPEVRGFEPVRVDRGRQGSTN